MAKVPPKSGSRALAKNSLVLKLAARLRERGETVGFAESCTGGLVSALFGRHPGVSDVFMGSVVAYSNHVKEELLEVPMPLIRSVGAVSLPVATKMATGLRAKLGVDWAVSITGVAGPGGGSLEKPVGTVCFGLAGPGLESGLAVRRKLDGDRNQIQMGSALFALRWLLRELR